MQLLEQQKLQDSHFYSYAHILIVDDQELNILLLEDILQGAGYTGITSTTDPREVASLFAKHKPDLVLLDLMMPYLNGFQVMEQLRSLIPQDSSLPIVVLTADISVEAKQRALSMGAQDFLTKPLNPIEVQLRVKNLLKTRLLHLQLISQNQTLEEKVRERTRELEAAQAEMLQRLALAAEHRDDETGQHTYRVAHTSACLARALSLPNEQVALIRQAAPLHDLGKIGVPDSILLKPGKLTPKEFEVIKTHTIIAAAILSEGRSDLIRMAQCIAMTHHERWDGSGYPRGLEGEAIPIEGRIVALADVFDALIHERPYKKSWNVEEAVAEIKRQKGKQFDPRVVEAFLAMEIWRTPQSLRSD